VSNGRTLWFHRFDSLPADNREHAGRGTFEARQVIPARVRVVVAGEIDATNREALGRFVERHTRISKQLVLDLSGVDFFGSQGFTALYYVNVQCVRRDVDWMIVANRIAQRILRICDSEGDLPVVDDLATAQRRLDHLTRYRNMISSVG
jgi:anti-anti-sigma factor